MTWILGSAIPFGYGALISDIRVTWQNRAHKDVLQKIYPIGSMMMAGFAGSVQLGFAMIEDMQRAFDLSQPPDFPTRRNTWFVQEACWRWHRRGRRIFRRAPARIRRLGCELLVVGTSPIMNGPWPWSRCVRMVAPDFFPQRETSGWTSIGCGAQHKQARAFAKSFFQENRQLLHSETLNPGGVAETTALFVAIDLGKDPLVGVSPLLQVGTVTAQEQKIKGVAAIPAGGPRVPPISLVQSWSDFLRYCGASGMKPAMAQT